MFPPKKNCHVFFFLGRGGGGVVRISCFLFFLEGLFLRNIGLLGFIHLLYRKLMILPFGSGLSREAAVSFLAKSPSSCTGFLVTFGEALLASYKPTARQLYMVRVEMSITMSSMTFSFGVAIFVD